MNIHLIVAVVVVGAATCASKPFEPHCKCLKTANSVRPETIVKVKIHKPSSFCAKKEVILIIRNSPEPVCIDPNGKFFTTFVEPKLLKHKPVSKTLLTTTRAEPAESSTASAKTLQASSTSTPTTAERQ